jgi:hypothetical protein
MEMNKDQKKQKIEELSHAYKEACYQAYLSNQAWNKARIKHDADANVREQAKRRFETFIKANNDVWEEYLDM